MKIVNRLTLHPMKKRLWIKFIKKGIVYLNTHYQDVNRYLFGLGYKRFTLVERKPILGV